MIGLALAALWALSGLLWRKWGRSDDKVRETLQEARRRVRSAGLGEIHFNGQPMLKPSELAKDATHSPAFSDRFNAIATSRGVTSRWGSRDEFLQVLKTTR